MLARVERTDFLQPMYVGELAHLSAKITYCSQHSLEVKVFVEAENIFSGSSSLICCTDSVLIISMYLIFEQKKKKKIQKVLGCRNERRKN